MLARCARCQGTFTTDRYGRQTCPHCGSELILPAPPGTPEAEAPPPAPTPETPPEAPAAQGPGAGGGTALPPPPGPPSGGYAPPPSGWGPPPGGGWSAPPGGGGGWGPPPGGGWGSPPGPPEAPSPFADRARRGFIAGFFETWKLVATQPEPFFSRVRVDQTGQALLFAVIASTVGMLFSTFYSWLSTASIVGAMQGMVSSMPEDQARFMRLWMDSFTSGRLGVAQIVLTPIIVFISCYVGAGVLHLLLRLFRGAHRGFDATLTVVAYANGLNLLLAVPGCGSLLVIVWSMIAVIVGLAAVHRCGMGRSTAAVLAPAVLLLVCCCGIFGAGLPGFLKGAHEMTRPGQTTQL